jgi:hypothetical protein
MDVNVRILIITLQFALLAAFMPILHLYYNQDHQDNLLYKNKKQ